MENPPIGVFSGAHGNSENVESASNLYYANLVTYDLDPNNSFLYNNDAPEDRLYGHEEEDFLASDQFTTPSFSFQNVSRTQPSNAIFDAHTTATTGWRPYQDSSFVPFIQSATSEQPSDQAANLNSNMLLLSPDSSRALYHEDHGPYQVLPLDGGGGGGGGGGVVATNEAKLNDSLVFGVSSPTNNYTHHNANDSEDMLIASPSNGGGGYKKIRRMVSSSSCSLRRQSSSRKKTRRDTTTTSSPSSSASNGGSTLWKSSKRRIVSSSKSYSSSLSKFTFPDGNGKRRIRDDIMNIADTLPSLPGLYFDKKQKGFRVRYQNVYVGWVALSRFPSIEEAYCSARAIWESAKNHAEKFQNPHAAVMASLPLQQEAKASGKNRGGRPRTVTQLPSTTVEWISNPQPQAPTPNSNSNPNWAFETPQGGGTESQSNYLLDDSGSGLWQPYGGSQNASNYVLSGESEFLDGESGNSYASRLNLDLDTPQFSGQANRPPLDPFALTMSGVISYSQPVDHEWDPSQQQQQQGRASWESSLQTVVGDD